MQRAGLRRVHVAVFAGAHAGAAVSALQPCVDARGAVSPPRCPVCQPRAPSTPPRGALRVGNAAATGDCPGAAASQLRSVGEVAALGHNEPAHRQAACATASADQKMRCSRRPAAVPAVLRLRVGT